MFLNEIDDVFLFSLIFWYCRYPFRKIVKEKIAKEVSFISKVEGITHILKA
jgi:hypothetical protein